MISPTISITHKLNIVHVLHFSLSIVDIIGQMGSGMNPRSDIITLVLELDARDKEIKLCKELQKRYTVGVSFPRAISTKTATGFTNLYQHGR